MYHFSSGITSFFIRKMTFFMYHFLKIDIFHTSFFRYHVIFHPKNDIFHISFSEKCHFSYIIFHPVSSHFSFFIRYHVIFHFSSGITSTHARLCREIMLMALESYDSNGHTPSFHAHIYLIYPEKSLYQLFWCGCMRLFCGYAGLICRYVRLLCGCQPVSTHISIRYILKRAYIMSM